MKFLLGWMLDLRSCRGRSKVMDMSPLDAITPATLRGAELLGLDQQIGSLTVDNLPDTIVVKGKPLENISGSTPRTDGI